MKWPWQAAGPLLTLLDLTLFAVVLGGGTLAPPMALHEGALVPRQTVTAGGLGQLAVGHLLLAVAFSGIFASSLPTEAHRGGARGMGAFLAFMIPVAGIGSLWLASFLLCQTRRPAGNLLEEFKEHTMAPVTASPLCSLGTGAQQIMSTQSTVEPLVDMLSTPDPQLKRAVLEMIAKRRNPKLIPHIIEALKDPRPEVYQFAMAKITNLQTEYARAISQAARAAKSAPADAGARRQLASVYGQYLRSGLVEESLRSHYEEQLRAEYAAVLSLEPGASNIRVALGRLDLKAGRLDEAYRGFRRVLDDDGDNVDGLLGLIETLYSQGEFRIMYAGIARLHHQLSASSELIGLTQWWLSRDAE